LKQALKAEKSVRDRLCGCDFGIMCLVIWFVIALLFFFVDINL